MMLLRNIADRLRQLVFLLHLHPVPGVGHNDRFAQLRLNRIMRIFHIVLVLNEIKRPLRLADVMIIRADPAQQAVRTNRFSRSLGQIAYHHAMVIGSRRLYEQLTQQRVVRVRQLYELQCRQNAKRYLEERHQANDQHCSKQPPAKEKPRAYNVFVSFHTPPLSMVNMATVRQPSRDTIIPPFSSVERCPARCVEKMAT